nr:MAG TPA: hypothetical protein [Caudoviricetes sp.]
MLPFFVMIPRAYFVIIVFYNECLAGRFLFN